jgi:hypothetical protein
MDMVGAGNRKFWYGHEKIGEDNFWFYLNHPPDCLCGCGEQSDWDEVNLLWKDFKNGHDRNVNNKTKNHLRRKIKARQKHQFNLFPLKEKFTIKTQRAQRKHKEKI